MRPGSRIERATSAELREMPERLRKAARIDVVGEDGRPRMFVFRGGGDLDPVPVGVWTER